jgi:cytochrome c55X
MMLSKSLIGHLFIQILILPSTVLATDIPNDRQQELLHLIKHDCGSCHGMTLKGGLGTPLTSEKLQGKSSEALSSIIMNGVRGTPMPPWKGILDKQEVIWMVKQLKTGILESN